jgi:TolB-like protein/Flp pilus assembly protein TadD
MCLIGRISPTGFCAHRRASAGKVGVSGAMQAGNEHENRRLGSWKEIAAFFDSDESTVRRWEKDRGLPVHRVPGGAGAKVFGYTDELARWLKRSTDEAIEPNPVPVQPAIGTVPARAEPETITTPGGWRKWRVPTAVLVALALVGTGLLLFAPRGDHMAIRAIAVLPLHNMTGDNRQDYLAQGMTDELITDLARISSLRVVSHTSVQQYVDTSKSLPTIAAELDVDAIVEGSVMRTPNGIRVNVQLLDARHDRHIWADVLERDMGDATSMQQELAEEIAAQIGVQLTPFEKQYFAGRHEVSPESFEDYLKGRYYWNKRTPDGLSKAEMYFKAAVTADTANPLAYAGLADTYLLDSLYSSTADSGTLEKARSAAAHALALDEQLAEAHCSMAYVLFLKDWNFGGAEREFRRALVLNPNFATAHQWYAEVLSVMGRHVAAIAEVRKAEELDPFSMIIHHEAGQILQNARDYRKAIEEYAKAEAIDPAFSQPHGGAAMAWRRLGVFDKAIAELRIAARLDDRFFGPTAVDQIADAYARSGPRGFLEETLAERRFYPQPAYSAALDQAALGQTDAAFVSLQEAYREHDLDTLSILCSPEFDRMRSDPRYASLLHSIGLRPAT